MEEFSVISEALPVEEIAFLRLRSLITDPDAFGERYETAAARTPEEWVEWLRKRTEGLHRKIFALKYGDHVVGNCGAGIKEGDPPEGYIYMVYLLPEYRGRGGADLLFQKVHQWVFRVGIRRIRAKVAAPNQHAIRFYQRLGYSVLGEDGFLREDSRIPVYQIELQRERWKEKNVSPK
ncbi:MAG TPA: GNAT family N-acetyltransferase [Thermotogota bacterium]|nr:GNAT family N-acetyltransferase [Thermotogota bacterium]